MNKISTDQITGLTADSRAVRPGFIFAALKGVKTDGRDYIPQAITAGAKIILTHIDTPDMVGDVQVIRDEQPRLRFAKMAAEFYGDQPENIVAVTGSNGKSSTVNFCRQLWALEDIKGASLGTIGVEADGIQLPAGMTTPDPVTLHDNLAKLKKAGITHLAMEASSHGLEQYRMHGVQLQAAGFTNLSRDHLDYHETMEKYLHAKMRLFREVLSADGTAVINADVPEFKDINTMCLEKGIRVFSYGHQGRDLKITSREVLPHGQTLGLIVMGKEFDVTLPLVGEFQAYNALCALGLAIACGSDASMTPNLEKLKGVRGRMECVGQTDDGAAVYVDYAHTPDGLETALKSLRPHAKGRLHAVFGCGGDRDRGKRPMMGKIAAELADRAIVTDDNPRSEDPAAIRAAVMQADARLIEVAGRRKAIATAIADLQKDDILIIAGKGHEQGQTIGDQILPFDDASVAREILKR